MDKQIESICWDANCFLAWFCEESGRVEDCDAIIDAAKNKKIKLSTSFLTLVEVANIPGLFSTISEDKIADFFLNPYIDKIALDWYVAKIARDLIKNYEIDVRDSIHLATAIHIKADTLHTYDKDHLLKLDNKIKNISLRIIRPTYPGQIKLPGT
jgi:predicted nucleic acid-binding protein